jgi:hypothetical protein
MFYLKKKAFNLSFFDLRLLSCGNCEKILTYGENNQLENYAYWYYVHASFGFSPTEKRVMNTWADITDW